MPETAEIPALIAGTEDRVACMNHAAPDQPPSFAAAIAKRNKLLADTSLPHWSSWESRCRLAAVAHSTGRRRRSYLAKVRPAPKRCSSASSRAIRRISLETLRRSSRSALRTRARRSRHARETVYVTNAVKHFKFKPRGKRRIHKKPNSGEVTACRWWLEQEIAAVKPKLIVALGATAASALARRPVSVMRERGPITFGPLRGFVTVHPSYLLRVPDAVTMATEYRRFVADLRAVSAFFCPG